MLAASNSRSRRSDAMLRSHTEQLKNQQEFNTVSHSYADRAIVPIVSQYHVPVLHSVCLCRRYCTA